MAAANRVKVVVRVRPFNSNERKADVPCIVSMEGNATRLLDPACIDEKSADAAAAAAALTPEQRELWTRTFRFDESLWSHAMDEDAARGRGGGGGANVNRFCGQGAVFEKVGCELVASALSGFHSTLLAYGQVLRRSVRLSSRSRCICVGGAS